MAQIFNKCLGCMSEFENQYEVCPNCGYVKNTPPKEAYHIKPETILKARYIVGKVVGFGGFGVTYIGWDLLLQQKVAIKEYFPCDFATRIPGNTDVSSFDGEKGEQYSAGLKRFMSEAKSLAKFSGTPGIVDIFDTFFENKTAYIIMEYLEGKDLKEYLKSKGGSIDFEDSMRIITPVLNALKAVHKENIIHRDISPDNIFMTNDGEIKLIDFGAARYATTTHSKSLSVILKPGYAPEEQYRSRGKQGPWSDIYAIGATLYRMLTGIVPEEAMERSVNDNVKDVTKLNPNIPEHAETAIMNALIVKADSRTQNISELERELIGEGEVSRTIVKQTRTDTGRWPLWLRIQVPIVAVLLLSIPVLWLLGFFDSEEVIPPSAPDMIKVPSLHKMGKQDAMNVLSGLDLQYVEIDSEPSIYAPMNTVMKQSPMQNTEATAGVTTVEVIISSGPEYAEMPDMTYKLRDDAISELGKLGFKVIIEEESKDIAPGAVISQNIEAGTQYILGKKVVLLISTGYEGGSVGKDVIVPNVVGMNFDDGKNTLMKDSLYILKEKEEWNEEIPAGEVISQLPEANSNFKTGDIVEVVVSKGKKQVSVPYVMSKSEREAISLLENLEFVSIELKYESSETVKEGHVISQSREANTIVYIYDENDITLTVSTGKPWSEKWAVESELPEKVKSSPEKYELSEITQYSYQDTGFNPGSWTGWSSSTKSGDYCATRTRYKTNSKEYTWNTSASLGGWTRTGTIDYTEWESWSAWQTSSVNSTTLRDVRTQSVAEYKTQYRAYHTLENGGCTGNIRSWTHYYPWYDSKVNPGACTVKIYGGSTNCGWTLWWYQSREVESGSHTEYSYRTRQEKYEYWRWAGETGWIEGNPPAASGDRQVTVEYSYQAKSYYKMDWSAWQSEKVNGSNTREVKTRKVYKYREK